MKRIVYTFHGNICLPILAKSMIQGISSSCYENISLTGKGVHEKDAPKFYVLMNPVMNSFKSKKFPF